MYSKSKWLILLVILLSAILVIAGCGRPADTRQQAASGPIVLKAGHNGPTSFPYHKGLEFFAKEVAEKSNGKMKVDIYPSAQLGDQRQMVEGLQLGTIDLCITATSDLAQFVPETDVLNLPFLFRDLQHSYKVADGAIGDKLAKAVEQKANLKVLGWWSAGVRSVFNSQKPIETPEDLKGMKIRTMPNKTDVDSFNALGAIATPIPYSELYTALQQDVIKAAENDPMSYYQMKFYEVCKYYSLTEHYINGGNRPLLISMKTWAKLSDEQKKIITEAAKKATDYERKLFEDESAKTMKLLEEKGVKINQVNKVAFQSAMSTVWDEVGKKSAETKQIITDIQNLK
jgi:tripartite ATP-independent transporter DctP family solute receptor